ncbi:hypothetical protein A3F29_00990 [Candidatus Roizmanbacteria bacterium RIFCSPHIGHO2_12_FULL_33_9]|uniref:Uncharacterized protein n=1 Tax=Candidatus Roizmanbacteria bacterium RIFCSPHIGHO2_12_FULL_33_9 TaxID=1802045 RepID=A0A1F7HIW2_9BACT|nr:MAG: hypothetical protein A3F29_00990 [Candidatus Roizmanbacteria bacterium RIFCSPHIGHO2_12_FULL_33_9]
MDYTQILLITTLAITTLFLILVGINIIFVLIELRKVLKKINSIAEGFEKLGQGLGHGLKETVSFFVGFKSLFKVLKVLGKENKSGKRTKK